jgi:two-component system CheB/CheR fusion protein
MPENTNVEVQNHHFLLKERKMNEILNYAIDDFFISLSVDFKEKAVGIILSGMGTDGTKGGTAIEKAGGVVLVQHPESAEYSGMPNNAIDHDHPDFILSPQKMGKYLLEYINKQATADHRDTDGSESHRE